MNSEIRELQALEILTRAGVRIRNTNSFIEEIERARIELEMIDAVEAACLNGPRVLGRLAPSQEALNRFIYPYLSFQKQYEIYPQYTMAVRWRNRNPLLSKP